MQDEETDKDTENAKKVHNTLNNIKEDEKKPETPTVAPAAASGPSMTDQ